LIETTNITTILFDLDGTIRYTKPDGNQLFRDFVQGLGYTFSNENEIQTMAWVHQYWADSSDLNDDEKKFGNHTFEFWQNYSIRHLRSLGLSAEESSKVIKPVLKYMERERENSIDHVPDEAYEMLSVLRKKGYCLGLVTNRGQPISELMEKLNLSDKFDFFLYAGEVDSWKPDEKIFLEALKLANATAEQTVYVGDNYFADVIGSKKVGMTPIFIDPIGWMDDPDCMVIRNIGKITEIFTNTVKA